MPRLLNKDTSTLHTPVVTLTDGKRAPSLALVPNVPLDVSLDHARVLARHPAIRARLERGLIVDADAEDERAAARRAEPSELAHARDQVEQARTRIRELEAQLAAAVVPGPKNATEAKKKIAELEADVADLMKDSDAKAARIRELEAQLAPATTTTVDTTPKD